MSVLAKAVPGPILDVKDLVERASLVATGEIVSVSAAGTTTIEIEGHQVRATRMAGVLHIDQLLKGSHRGPQLQFHFFVPELPNGFGGVRASSYRLLLLSGNSGSYTFASPYYPSLPAVPGVAARHTDTLEDVTLQLAAVAQLPGSLEQQLEATHALGTVKTKFSAAVLRNLLTQEQDLIRLTAAAALLQANDISGLPVAESFLMQPPEGIPAYMLLNLVFAIQNGVKDQKAVAGLLRLLNAPRVDVRRAAAFALRETGSQRALSALAMALNDADQEVRYYAVIGLAEITDQPDWRPLNQDFVAAEANYLEYWRRWARENLR